MSARLRGRLAEFQDVFARALLLPLCEVPRELAGIAAQPGFAVYRNTVMKGCIDALQANYPAVCRLVGEEWFRAAAATYARARLPESASLLEYGDGFADFLAGFAPAAELPYLAEVARLERLWTEAHSACDWMPLAAAALARRTPQALGRTVLRPLPAARWAWFPEHPAYTIWRQNRDAPEGAQPFAGKVEWRAEGVLLVRPHACVEHRALNEAGCAFLDACAAGRDLAAAGAAALAREPGADLARLMQELLEAGAFAAAVANEQAREPR
jgi:hypothetical protein